MGPFEKLWSQPDAQLAPGTCFLSGALFFEKRRLGTERRQERRDTRHSSITPMIFELCGKTDGPILRSYGSIPPRSPFSARSAEKCVVTRRHDENRWGETRTSERRSADWHARGEGGGGTSQLSFSAEIAKLARWHN